MSTTTDNARIRLETINRQRYEVICDALVERLATLNIHADERFREALWQVVEDHA